MNRELRQLAVVSFGQNQSFGVLVVVAVKGAVVSYLCWCSDVRVPVPVKAPRLAQLMSASLTAHQLGWTL